jgi:hypothetical protein
MYQLSIRIGIGASIGSYKSGSNQCTSLSLNNKGGVGGILPLIMAGILSVYGLIVSIFISGNSRTEIHS